MPVDEGLWGRIPLTKKERSLKKPVWWSIAASMALMIISSFWGKDFMESAGVQESIAEKETVPVQHAQAEGTEQSIISDHISETHSSDREFPNIRSLEKRVAKPYPKMASFRDPVSYPSHYLESREMENSFETVDDQGVAVRIQLVFTDPFPDEEKSGLGKKINKFNKKLKKDLDFQKVKTRAKKALVSNDKKKQREEHPDIN